MSVSDEPTECQRDLVLWSWSIQSVIGLGVSRNDPVAIVYQWSGQALCMQQDHTLECDRSQRCYVRSIQSKMQKRRLSTAFAGL